MASNERKNNFALSNVIVIRTKQTQLPIHLDAIVLIV